MNTIVQAEHASIAAAVTPAPTFTLWTGSEACAKGYRLSPDGELVSVPAGMQTYFDAMPCSFGLDSLAELLRKLRPGHFLTAGVSRNTKRDPQARRLKAHYPHPPGPGLLILDGDGLDILGIDSAQGYVDAVRALDPALAGVGFVVSPSASSHVRCGDVDRGLRGLHAFCVIDDARQIPMVLEHLHSKSLADGRVRVKISKRGVILCRSLVDLAMRTPHQPCFEGGVRLLSEGISQDREITVFSGGVLRAASLNIADGAVVLAARKREDSLRRKHKPAAEAQRDAWRTARTMDMIAQGVAPEAAQTFARKMLHGTHEDLPADWVLKLDDGRVVTVAAVLADTDRFDGATLADPLEPEEGPGRAILYCGKGQDKPLVHSCAHGGSVCYFLKNTPVNTSPTSPTSPDEEGNEDLSGLQGTSDDKSIFTHDAENFTDFTQTDETRHPFTGALLYFDDKGTRHRHPPSFARNRIAPYLRNTVALEADAQAWHKWTGTHWTPDLKGTNIHRAVHDLCEIGYDSLGFGPNNLRAIVDLLKAGNSLPLPDALPNDAVPFKNGVLWDGTLYPATPAQGARWCLPYDYDAAATCPAIQAWLLSAVGGDALMVEYLRAWLAAILTGRADLQRFLYLVGPGGTGKSTFVRLAVGMIGHGNAYTTTLEQLEKNRFENAGIYGKRLVILNDEGRYGGALDALKALTGQDHLRLEPKNTQQGGSFVYDGMVLMTSNVHLVSSDQSSGLDRRRAVVSFNRVVSDAERQDWKRQGGEELVLHREMPGLINWLLRLSPEEVTHAVTNPPPAVAASLQAAMLANNPVARWLVEHCAPAPATTITIIGQSREILDTGERIFADADEHLYPSFLTFSASEKIGTLSRGRFVDTLKDTFRTLTKHHSLEVARKPHDGRHGLRGIRLLGRYDPKHDWFPKTGEDGERG